VSGRGILHPRARRHATGLAHSLGHYGLMNAQGDTEAERQLPGLLRQAAIVYAGMYGIMTAVALRYWFPAPLLFLAAAFSCFAAAVATAPGRPSTGA
jgi:hypothetical protein